MKGTVKIETDRVRTGMIRLGKRWTCMNQRLGFHWLNWGGVTFVNSCVIANDAVVEIGHSGNLIIGNNVNFNAGLRLSCYKHIRIGDDVLGSWDISIFDTDFHRLTKNNELITSCSKEIIIGKQTWICFGTTILKGAKLGDKCVLGAKSILSSDFGKTNESVLVGSPAKVVKTGYYLDINNCLPEWGYFDRYK